MKIIYIIAFYFLGLFTFIYLMEFFIVDSLLKKVFLDKITNNNVENSSFLQTDEGKNTILQPDDSKKPLKLSKEEIGRHTWALLHSIAASFPSIPNDEQKNHLEKFMISLSEIYPCKVCATHLKEMLKNFPIRNKSREEFVYYLCDLHNKVNIKLDKPIYDCRKSFEIWGGDCGCDVNN